jgi:hypothetical protein
MRKLALFLLPLPLLAASYAFTSPSAPGIGPVASLPLTGQKSFLALVMRMFSLIPVHRQIWLLIFLFWSQVILFLVWIFHMAVI